MHFVQKVENFFFPCSKVIKTLKAEHESTMEDFRQAVSNVKCAIAWGGDAAAQCIVENMAPRQLPKLIITRKEK
jgi:hypothetical protein